MRTTSSSCRAGQKKQEQYSNFMVPAGRFTRFFFPLEDLPDSPTFLAAGTWRENKPNTVSTLKTSRNLELEGRAHTRLPFYGHYDVVTSWDIVSCQCSLHELLCRCCRSCQCCSSSRNLSCRGPLKKRCLCRIIQGSTQALILRTLATTGCRSGPSSAWRLLRRRPRHPSVPTSGPSGSTAHSRFLSLPVSSWVWEGPTCRRAPCVPATPRGHADTPTCWVPLSDGSCAVHTCPADPVYLPAVFKAGVGAKRRRGKHNPPPPRGPRPIG